MAFIDIGPIQAGRKRLIHRSPGDKRLGKILHPAFNMRGRAHRNHQSVKTEIRPSWVFVQLHIRLPGRSVPLFHVAGLASHYHIDPSGFPATGFRNDMVYGQGIFPIPAVLASKIISSQYIFLAEGYTFSHFALDQIEHTNYRRYLQGH